MKLCKNCKTELEDNQKFCHRCGCNEFEIPENAVFENDGEISVQSENQNVIESINNTRKKIIILISAIAAVLVVIIAIFTIISLKSSDKPRTAESDITITQGNEETTESRDMVSLISLCPTYEEFMDKLSSSKITNKSSNKTSDNHINVTFDYSGVTVTIWYSENEPHNINSVMIGTMTGSPFNQSWFNSVAYNSGELLFLYLEGVPGSDSSETMYEKFNNTTKTEEKSGMITVTSEYKNKGTKYHTTLSSTSYTCSYSISVEIDEKYMVEKPETIDQSPTDSKETTDLDEPTNLSDNNTSDNNSADNTISNNNAGNATTLKNNTNTTNRVNSSAKAGNSDSCANGHNWVAVTKTVYQKEEGHYENVTEYKSVQKIKCPCCSSTFDSYSSYTSHFQKHIDADPNTKFIMDSYGKTTVQEPYTEKQWIVDSKAYDEEVITGYKCSICGKTK